MKLIVLAATAAVLLGGCGDDNDGAGPPPSTTAEASSETTEADNAAIDYLDLLAENDLGSMTRMLELATPGSPAHLYATHQIAVVRLAGTTPSISTSGGDDAVEMCYRTLDAAGNEIEECNTFAGFETDQGTGLLESFTVDDVNIRERITAGAPQSGDGVTVQVRSSYQTARGDLAVNVDISNARPGPIAVADYEWAYVGPDNRQVAPSEEGLAGPDIEPGATAGFVALFPQTVVGGTLRFVAFADDFGTEIRFDVPTA
jgi:hypothetical protein